MIKKFTLLAIFFIFIYTSKVVHADCRIENSLDNIRKAGRHFFEADNGSKICQFSSILSGKHDSCYGVQRIDNNILQVISFGICSYEREKIPISAKPEFGNYFECIEDNWSIRQGNGVCYMMTNNENEFWKDLDSNIVKGEVKNLKIEIQKIPTPTLIPQPEGIADQKKCVVPDKVDFWGNVKSIEPQLRLNFNEAYCKKNDRGVSTIYVCNDQAKQSIKTESGEEFYVAFKQSECIVPISGEKLSCNFENSVKKINEIFCEKKTFMCKENEDCLSFCPEETHYSAQIPRPCGELVNGQYEGVCCPRKITNVQLDEEVIPLLTCGNGEAKLGEKSKRCCPMTQKNTYYSLSPFFSLIEKIPILGSSVISIYEKFIDKTIDIQNKVTYEPCFIGYPSTPNNLNDPQCLCLSQLEITPTPFQSVREMCERYLPNLEGKFTKENENCKSCAEKAGMWTAFGCLRGNFSDFIKFNIFGTALSLAGLFAILCIIYSAIILQTSAGNPEKIKKAQELLTSCIMGLVLIIFSIFLLRLIGVDILKIPGFGK